MTLHLLGIAAEESDEPQTECDANPIDQFWMAAGDLLIEIVKRQPDIQPIIDAVIDAGGDIRSPRTIKRGKSHLPWLSLRAFGMCFSLMRGSS